MNTFIDQDGKLAGLTGKPFVQPPPSPMTPKPTTGNSEIAEGDPEDPRKYPGIELVRHQQRTATEALAPLAQSRIKTIDSLQKVTGLKREVCEAALNIAGDYSQGAFQLLVQSKQIFQIA